MRALMIMPLALRLAGLILTHYFSQALHHDLVLQGMIFESVSVNRLDLKCKDLSQLYPQSLAQSSAHLMRI